MSVFENFNFFLSDSLSDYSQTGVQSIEQHTSNLEHLKSRSKRLLSAEKLQNCVEKNGEKKCTIFIDNKIHF